MHIDIPDDAYSWRPLLSFLEGPLPFLNMGNINFTFTYEVVVLDCPTK